MEKTDVVIVGAGLLGCFAARALSAWQLRTLVLEQREDVCTGLSRANTGIVYTGCDTKPGTLKTRLCVRANAGFAALCETLDVRFRRCGSLMAAFGPRAETVLEKKYRTGLANGVPGLEWLDGRETLRREPGLAGNVLRGLYAPGTGTVDPWELGIAAYENARHNGAEFRFNESVHRLARAPEGFVLETERMCYRARAVLNCAGLSADAVRELAERPLVRLFPTAGDYLVMDAGTDACVRHVIFHEPEERGKGLTLVPTVDGNVLVGPTERTWDGAPGFPTGLAGQAELEELCRRFFPALPLHERIRSFGALRPNPYYVHPAAAGWEAEDKSISSFTVLEEAGLFSLLGIKTPGLTCADELGRYAAEKILAWLGGAAPNTSYDPRRRGIPRVRELDGTARAALIARDPDYGRLLCRCREITRGEAREAIRRGAVTVDGVKRRTGATGGRCQGSYCTQGILELLAAELGCAPEAVTKDGAGSPLLKGGADGTH